MRRVGVQPARSSECPKLRAAHESRNGDPLEIELGKLYLAAAREGIAFGLNTPTESAKLAADIESAPREKAGGVTYSR
jgi:hypothetical protein